jgi:membrane carboxypeptidase/penicillin-binding protein PbpC
VKKALLFFLTAVLIAVLAYAASGYVSAASHSGDLKERAKTLTYMRQGADALGQERLEFLLRVQDPGFYDHRGVDVKTAGAGITTITQSLSKRLAFKAFKPGIGKIRQTTYALALEKHLTKEEVLALFLETVPMGHGPDGWTVGFFKASQSFYGAVPHELNDSQFIELISVMISPGVLNYRTRNKIFTERIARIARLQQGECRPINNKDVWFEACAAKS